MFTFRIVKRSEEEGSWGGRGRKLEFQEGSSYRSLRFGLHIPFDSYQLVMGGAITIRDKSIAIAKEADKIDLGSRHGFGCASNYIKGGARKHKYK